MLNTKEDKLNLFTNEHVKKNEQYKPESERSFRNFGSSQLQDSSSIELGDSGAHIGDLHPAHRPKTEQARVVVGVLQDYSPHCIQADR